MKLTYNVNAKPRDIGYGKIVLFAFQQLLAILAATIAVPAIIGNGMSQSAALFGAGVGTLVYQLFTRFKSPVFLGSSFAFLGSMFVAFGSAASMAMGYLGLLVGAAFAGLVYVIIAVITKFAGVKWIKKLMPALIIGPTVAIIGLSLAGNAIGDLQKGNYATSFTADDYQIVAYTDTSIAHFDDDTKTYVTNTPANIEVDAESKLYIADKESDSYLVVEKGTDTSAPIQEDRIHNEVTVTPVKDNETGKYTLVMSRQDGSVYIALLCGLVTLLVTIITSVYGKKSMKTIPFIIGICAGYALAAIFTLIGTKADIAALRIIDFSKFNNLQWVPDFSFLKAFNGGFEGLTPAYIGTIAVAYIPVAFVVFAEHIADHRNISSIIEKDLLEDPGLSNTLLGDGIGSVAGAFFGGCPNTTYGESIGCVAISGNASVCTITVTAFMAIIASFIAPFVTFLATIPSCVMGGVCIALYGFIAVSGLKMLQKVDLEKNKNLFVVSVILICGIGGLTVSFGEITITSIACALILGIITNLILNIGKKDKKDEQE